MQHLHVLSLFLSMSHFTTLASTAYTNSSADREPVEADPSSLPSDLILQRNAQIASRLAAGPVHGVKKMSDDEGEKFFLDYWSFMDTTASGNLSERSYSDEDAFSPARFMAQSYPFDPSYSSFSDNPDLFPRKSGDSETSHLEARNFKCPAGTSACLSIGRSDRCCGSEETCQLVVDTGHGNVGCCPSWKKCSGMIGSCERGYTACSTALGGGCCIPGYQCVEGGCAYVTVITVTLHSTAVLSTVTYSTKPQDTASASSSCSTASSHSSIPTTTNDSLAAPGRPTGLSTATSITRGDDVCPTGFYACSAVYHGGCCRTGRDCDTTSCPTTSSTTFISGDVTIVAPVATTTEHPGGNQCAKGWFHCADTVGGGCCPMGFACGSSCTATDTASAATVAKEQPTSADGMVHPVNKIMLGMMFGINVGIWSVLQ